MKTKPSSQHGNSKANCWRYFGNLFDQDDNIVDADRLYCKLCLDEQQAQGNGGHISEVANFAAKTASGNMNLHLSNKHDIATSTQEKTNKIIGYLKKSTAEHAGKRKAQSKYEVTRDIVVWFCRDLTPFLSVEKDGFTDFFAKNLPNITLPSADTLSNTALEDVYQALLVIVKDRLSTVNSICLMFDGWTDRYRARPYLGVRASFLQNWEYNIVTLGVHVLPSHTARAVADHVSSLLKKFFLDPKKLFITSCHDGAANMVASSKLLKVDSYQHCSAHALHLLLTADSINQSPAVTELIQKCKDIVSALHFKSTLIDDELAATEDQKIVDKLHEKMAALGDLLDMDDQYSTSLTDELETEGGEAEPAIVKNQQDQEHHHATLKKSCPTRWNSTLSMLESILQLQNEVSNALKRSGRRDLCLHQDELDFLDEFRKFLKPFQELTDLFSSSVPTLSLIPLMKVKVKKLCICTSQDDERLKFIKKAVLQKLDKRFPENDSIKLHQLLDPDTKGLIPRPEATVILESALKNAFDRNLIIIAQPRSNSVLDQADTEGQPEAVAIKRRKLREEMLCELRGEAPETANQSQVAVEVAHYLTSSKPGHLDDVLQYWKHNEQNFPHLCKLAQLHLSSSATSVPVESMFSTTGLIVNSKRSMLSAEKLNRVSFVHDNYRFVGVAEPDNE